MRSHGQDVDNTKTRSSSSSISSFAACEARWSKLAEPADRLIRPPSKLTSTYVDRYGRTTFDDTYALGWTSTRPPPIGANHPKIIRARNNGNWSEKLEAYYSELPPNYNIPLAGQACKKPDEDWSSRSPTRVATPHGTDFGPFTVLLDALAKIRKPREPTAGQKMWECQFAPKEMRKEKVRLVVVIFFLHLPDNCARTHIGYGDRLLVGLYRLSCYDGFASAGHRGTPYGFQSSSQP